MLPKYILFICLLFLSVTNFVANGQLKTPTTSTKWIISENSSLYVNGSTNINKFSCDIPDYDQTDTLTLGKRKINKEIALSGSINLNIQNFDCHNVIMTNDLRKTLKCKQFPRLHINFLSLKECPDLTAKPEHITGQVDIILAGVCKRFEVNYQISVDAQKVIHLLGYRDVNFSDFNLIPPKKLGGMIQTKDKLSVAFHLKMKTMD